MTMQHDLFVCNDTMLTRVMLVQVNMFLLRLTSHNADIRNDDKSEGQGRFSLVVDDVMCAVLSDDRR